MSLHASIAGIQARQREQREANPRPARIRMSVRTRGTGTTALTGRKALDFGAHLLEEPTFTFGVSSDTQRVQAAHLPVATATVMKWIKTEGGLYVGAEVGFNVYSDDPNIRLKFSLVFEASTLRTTVGTGTSSADSTRGSTSQTTASASAATPYVPSSGTGGVSTGTPDTTPPGPVTGLTATPTDTTVALAWTNPDDTDLAGVMLRRAAGTSAPSASTGTLVTKVAAPSTAFTDYGLAASTQYTYALFAYDTDGNTASAATASVTTAAGTQAADTTPPAPVTNLSAIPSATTVALAWTNPTDTDLAGVMIRRAAGSTAPSETSGTLVAEVAKPGTAYTDHGLAGSTQYTYAVFAYDSSGNNAAGVTTSVTTTAASSGYDRSTWGYGPYASYDPGVNGQSGVPAAFSSQLVDDTTTTTITAAGTYRFKRFKRLVQVKANGVIFEGCEFVGDNSATSNTGLVNCDSSALSGGGVKFYDCTFDPAFPSIWLDAVHGHDYEMYRCHIRNTVDGVGVFNIYTPTVNVKLYGNYIHDLSFFSPDPNHSKDAVPATHNDCIQWGGGANLTVVGNNLNGTLDPTIGAASLDQAHRDPVAGGGPNNSTAVATNPYGYNPRYPKLAANSCIQITNGTSQCTGLVMDSNFMDAGGFAINIGSGSGNYDALGYIRNNKFGHASLFGPIAAPSAGATINVTATITGNVYKDTGAAVLITKGSSTLTPMPTGSTGTGTVTAPAITGFSLVLDEQWTSIDPARWKLYDNSTFALDHGRLQRWMARNAIVGAPSAGSTNSSSLKLLSKRETVSGTAFTAAMVDSKSAGVFYPRYMTCEIRCKIPHGQGIWPAFWFTAMNGGATMAEFDFLEYFHGAVPGHISVTLHGTDETNTFHTTRYTNNGGSNPRTLFEPPTYTPGWHTWRCEVVPVTDATGSTLGDPASPSHYVRYRVWLDGVLKVSFVDTSALKYTTDGGTADKFWNIYIEGSQISGDNAGHPDDPLGASRTPSMHCLNGGTPPNTCNTTFNGQSVIRAGAPGSTATFSDPATTFEIDYVRVYKYTR